MTANEIKVGLMAANPDLSVAPPLSSSKVLKMLNCSRDMLKEYIEARVIPFTDCDSDTFENKSPVKHRYYTYIYDIIAYKIMLSDINFPFNFPQEHQKIVLKYNKPAGFKHEEPAGGLTGNDSIKKLYNSLNKKQGK